MQFIHTMRIRVNYLVILFFFCSSFSLTAQVNTSDSLALVAIYNATNGPNWTNNTNWLTAAPVSTWYGITTFANRVHQLFLNGNGLDGSLPGEIGDLTEVRVMWLIGNSLSGLLPTEIGDMDQLRSLYLIGNRFSGPIPASVGNLANLNEFNANSNYFDSAIPAEFGLCLALRTLSITRNNLTGNIPTELGDIPALETLELQFNQLDGAIPTSLTRPPNLRLLNLHDNQLVGSIPEDIGLASFLTGVSLHNNFLSGTIPIGFGQLDNLLVLNLSGNLLTGDLPEELGDMNSVINVYLEDNNLDGILPSGIADVGDFPSLRELKIQNNSLTGAIPSTLENLPSLRKFVADNNNFSGAIPPQIGNIPSLETLFLHNNNLEGSVPTTFINLTNLKYLDLSDNDIEDLPTLASMTGLLHFKIENNKLTFEDLEVNKDLAPGAFTFAPQQKVGTADAFSVNPGTIVTMETLVGGSDNEYEWRLNGVQVPGGNTPQLKIADFQSADVGVYDCHVISKVFGGLTIVRHPIEIDLNTTLPVELVSFTATPKGAVVNLEWITAFEENNDYFEIERSKKGVQFNTLTKVDGAGTVANGQNTFYNYQDRNPILGTSYYRLKQVDLDGTFQYSQVVSVKLAPEAHVAYPNPTVQGTPVNFIGDIEGQLSVEIYNVQGVMVYQSAPRKYDRFQNIEVPTDELIPGVYVLSVRNEKDRKSRKLVVK